MQPPVLHVGNELSNRIVIPGAMAEMDARPAKLVTIPRVCQHGDSGAQIMETEHVAPGWANVAHLKHTLAGCGSD